MGETRKIVVASFPVDELPAALREGLESGRMVRVTVEADTLDGSEPSPRPLHELVGTGKGCFASPDEALAAIRALREEWQ